MQKKEITNKRGVIYIPLIMSGLGIGWLVGLSVSPVVSIVLTSVTGSAAAIVAALSGLDNTVEEASKKSVSRWIVNPFPLAMLICGIVCGSILGIIARNQSWLGSEISSEVAKWTQAGFADLSEDDMVKHLFNSRYPISSTVSSPVGATTNSNDVKLGSYLFAVPSQECGRLRQAMDMANKTADESHLIQAIKNSTIDQFPKLLIIITDTVVLKNVLEQVICPNGQS